MPMQTEAVPTYEMFIGGAWVGSHSGRNYPVFNPATGQQTAVVDLATPEEVDTVVADALRVASPVRDLAGTAPDRYHPELVQALVVLANAHEGLGQAAEAQSARDESAHLADAVNQ